MHYAAAFALLAALDNAEGEVFARVRGTYTPHLGEAGGLPASLITSVIRHGTGADLVRIAAPNSDVRVATEILATAGPAVAVLRFLRHCGSDDAQAYLRPMAEVTGLLDRHLGADPCAWSRLLAMLPDCQGTVAELIEAAGAGAGGTEAIPAPPRAVAVDWRQLLLFARPERLAALVPHLRPRTVLDLVHFGARLPGPIVAEAVRRATPRQRAALAVATHPRADAYDALLALADPKLNALIYLNPRAGERERNLIMASAGEVPLDPVTIARVIQSDNPHYRRPGVWSGDPKLVRAAMLRVRNMGTSVAKCMERWEQGGIEALRPLFHNSYQRKQHEPFMVPAHRGVLLGALLGLWDRHGVAAAESLVDDLPLRASTAARLRALFAAGDAGRARMRTECARALDKRMFKGEWLAPLGFRLAVPGYPQTGWAACAEEPPRKEAARLLSTFPGCPDPIVAAAEADGKALRVRWPVVGDWVPAVARGDMYTNEVRRLRIELAKIPGLAERVFNGASSAERALELYNRIQRYAEDARLRETQRARMPEYLREYLGTSLEARVIAARMAPSFAGTLPELLATAAAAAG
ncbi:hypothetical protein [Embleya sp. AB8]|uniref:hypothetical protein n=1 Tax=Embleya sp. AB8 TaxID=3156304 RepID=UPI003C75F65F